MMTMYDNRTRLSYEVWQEVSSHYPKKVFNTAIPRTIRLSEAPSFGKTILEYDPRSMSSSISSVDQRSDRKISFSSLKPAIFSQKNKTGNVH